MKRGNTGLLALCILLAAAAFGIVFIAPEMMVGNESGGRLADEKPVSRLETPAAPDETTDPADRSPDPALARSETVDEGNAETSNGAAPGDDAPIASPGSGADMDDDTAGIDPQDERPDASTPAAPPAELALTPDEGEPDALDPGEQADRTPARSEASSEGPTAETRERTALTPAFDILRVEPDGSTLIAGRAEPGTKLDVMDGADVVASADVSPSGDFAAVLDRPLAPGDHQLRLRSSARAATDGDNAGEGESAGGEAVVSDEVATISIPRDGGSETLAMITRPGQASRVIVQPEADRPTEPSSGPAAESVPQNETANAAEPEGAENRAVNDAPATTGQPVATDSPSTQSAEGDASPIPSERREALAVARPEPADIPAIPDEPAAQDLLDADGDETDLSDPVTETDSEVAERPGAVDDGDLAGDAPGDESPALEASGQETESAALSPARSASSPAPDASDEPQAAPVERSIRIDAVEVEGDDIFVTGSASPAGMVMVYAGDRLAGGDRVGVDERFLVEGRLSLAVGEHDIRADLLVEGRVVARALVPFFRPAGETAAAVADAEPPAAPNDPAEELASLPASPAPEGSAPAPVGDAPASSDAADPVTPDVGEAAVNDAPADTSPADATDAGSLDAAAPNAATPALQAPSSTVPAAAGTPDETAEDVLPDDGVAQTDVADGSVDQGEETADGAETPSSPPASPREIAEQDTPDSGAPAASGDASAPAPAEDGLALAAPEENPTGEDTRPQPANGGDDENRPVSDAPGDADAQASARLRSSGPVEDAGASGADSSDIAEDVTVVRQPALTPTDESVIIRRGDTLWQISRRVYGRGVRYTTIYLANQQQIADPDRILPGQLFDVPGKALENAEELHRELLAR